MSFNLSTASADTHSFNVALAELYGVEEAILLKHLVHWIRINHKKGRNRKDGRTWMYETRERMTEVFPYWSERRIRTLTKSLVKQGAILTGNYNKHKMDRTCWYALRDEKMFTKDQSDNSSDQSDNSSDQSDKWSDQSDRAIPDIETDIETNVEKDNVCETLPSSTKEEKKGLKPKKQRFYTALNTEQRKLHDKLIKHKPLWGEPLKSDDVCAWFLSKKWNCQQIQTAFDVYRQDCAQAESKGARIDSMGAYMVKAVKDERKPRDRNYELNKQYAEKLAEKHKFLRCTQRYVAIGEKECCRELIYSLPTSTFISQLDEYVKLELFKEE